MAGRHGTFAQLAVAMLGIIAVGGVAFGVLLVVLAPGAGREVQDSIRATAILVTALAGFMAIVFGALAGVAARLVWIGRAWGRTLAYAVALVVVIGPIVAALSGGWHPALAASVVLGVALASCLLLEPAAAIS